MYAKTNFYVNESVSMKSEYAARSLIGVASGGMEDADIIFKGRWEKNIERELTGLLEHIQDHYKGQMLMAFMKNLGS